MRIGLLFCLVLFFCGFTRSQELVVPEQRFDSLYYAKEYKEAMKLALEILQTTQLKESGDPLQIEYALLNVAKTSERMQKDKVAASYYREAYLLNIEMLRERVPELGVAVSGIINVFERLKEPAVKADAYKRAIPVIRRATTPDESFMDEISRIYKRAVVMQYNSALMLVGDSLGH